MQQDNPAQQIKPEDLKEKKNEPVAEEALQQLDSDGMTLLDENGIAG